MTYRGLTLIVYEISHHSLTPYHSLLGPSTSGLIGRAMPHDSDSPHHASYKDSHHIRGSISQGSKRFTSNEILF